jgi:hypothetical protein
VAESTCRVILKPGTDLPVTLENYTLPMVPLPTRRTPTGFSSGRRRETMSWRFTNVPAQGELAAPALRFVDPSGAVSGP